MYSGDGIGYPLAPRTKVVTVPAGSEGAVRSGAADAVVPIADIALALAASVCA